MATHSNPLIDESKRETSENVSAALALVSHALDQLSNGREMTTNAEHGIQLVLEAVDEAQQTLLE